MREGSSNDDVKKEEEWKKTRRGTRPPSSCFTHLFCRSSFSLFWHTHKRTCRERVKEGKLPSQKSQSAALLGSVSTTIIIIHAAPRSYSTVRPHVFSSLSVVSSTFIRSCVDVRSKTPSQPLVFLFRVNWSSSSLLTDDCFFLYWSHKNRLYAEFMTS